MNVVRPLAAKTQTLRSGAEYLASIKDDGRRVLVDGEAVKDVTSQPAHKQSDPTLHAGVVKERDDGIVLKGAQQLATGAAFADAVYISCIHPLVPGDEAYAFAVAVLKNAPALKIYTRRPYAANATSA